MGDGDVLRRIGTVVECFEDDGARRGVVVSARCRGASEGMCEVVLLGAHVVGGIALEDRVVVDWSQVRVNDTATRAFSLLLAPRRGRQTPALASATESSDVSLCSELVRMGAIVDESAYWHEIFAPRDVHWNAETALVIAARQASSQSHVDIYERLLSGGADFDLPGCLMGDPGVVASARTLLFDEPGQQHHGHNPRIAEKMKEATLAAQAGWTRDSHRLFGPNARRAILAATTAVSKIPIALWEIHVLSFLSRSHWLERARSFNNFSVGGAVHMPKSMVAYLTRAYFFCDTHAEWHQMQIHLAPLVLAARNGRRVESSSSSSRIHNWYAEPLPWVPRTTPNAKLRLEWRHGDWYGPWPPQTSPEVGTANNDYVFASNDRDTDLVWCGFYIRGKDWLDTDKALRHSLAIPGLT